MTTMAASPVDWEDDAILGLDAIERNAVVLGSVRQAGLQLIVLTPSSRLDDRIFGRLDASDEEICEIARRRQLSRPHR